jgi:hypothetical protein
VLLVTMPSHARVAPPDGTRAPVKGDASGAVAPYPCDEPPKRHVVAGESPGRQPTLVEVQWTLRQAVKLR